MSIRIKHTESPPPFKRGIESRREGLLHLLYQAAVTLRILTLDRLEQGVDVTTLIKTIDETLFKLDEIPAGLALGQAAYKSGYGTSRFAVEGNALFG